MKGQFIGIGVGPGAPDLLTIRAVHHLEKLDILVVPAGKKNGMSEAYQIVASYLPSTVEIQSRHFPMIADQNEMMAAIAVIAKEIEALVQTGKKVGFVTLGDPMLYSTYIYLLKCMENNIETLTIPGISSYSAMASGLNRPLAEGDAPLLIYPCTGDLVALENAIDQYDSLVLMKVYKSFDAVRNLLIEKKILPYAVAVSNYGKDNQVIHHNLDQVDSSEISYFTTIIINKNHQV